MGKFLVDDIDTSLCTHYIYAFAVLDGENHVMKAHDGYLDLDRSGSFKGWNKGFFRKFTDLKKKNPKAKYLVRTKTFLEISIYINDFLLTVGAGRLERLH